MSALESYPSHRLLMRLRPVDELSGNGCNPESCYAPIYRSAPRWCPILGAKRERPAARRCGQMRSDAGQLSPAQCSDQHIHSQSGPLFERLPSSGRRGRRFKSGHPDQLRGASLPAAIACYRCWYMAEVRAVTTRRVPDCPSARASGGSGRFMAVRRTGRSESPHDLHTICSRLPSGGSVVE